MRNGSLRVLIDGAVFCLQRNGGISRVFQKMLAEIVALEPALEVEIILPAVPKTSLPEAPRIVVSDLPRVSKDGRPWRIRQYLQGLMPIVQDLYWRCRRSDVFLSTYYTTPPVRAPRVAVVHDMIHELFPDSFSVAEVQDALRQKNQTLESASAIVCVSRRTQEDLQRLAGVSPERCHVVYSASGLEGVMPRDIAEKDPFVLYVGDFSRPYKNFDRLADAVLGSEDSVLRDLRVLVCSSWGPDRKCLERYDRALSSGRLVFRHVQSDEELAGLYSQCSVFVYPSIYEGFGIPVVEALQFGAPVACSRTASIPEAGGGAVTYFDPLSIEDIRGAIVRAVFSGRSAVEVERRQQQAACFSWRKTALGYLDVIRSVIV